MGIKSSPSSRRKTIASAVIFAIVAVWFSNLCLAADNDPAADAPVVVTNSPIAEAGTEKFVPNLPPISCSGTLQMLKTAEITGKVIRIRQVVRWSEADSASFSSIADLVIDRYDDDINRKLTLDDLRTTLTGAGVNLGTIRFAGATCCLCSHADTPAPALPATDHQIVEQWMAKSAKVPPEKATGEKASAEKGLMDMAPVMPASAVLHPDSSGSDASPFHSLRDLLLSDVSQRLNVPEDQLQMTFDPKDRSLLNLSDSAVRFELEPKRVRDLGRVSWDVTITSGDKQQKVFVTGEARAWQKQFVVGQVAGYRHVMSQGDITERRVLVDHISDDPVLTKDQIVGQQAARDLKPGTVLTARLVDPVPLCHNGDSITINLYRNNFKIRTTATAMESGSFGQTIKVKSDESHQTYQVLLTGQDEACIGTPPAIDAPESTLATVQP